MIYLIGGPPKSGKTFLAKSLSKKINTYFISTDSLQNIIKPYVKDIKESFPASLQRCNYNDEKYSKYSTEEIIIVYKNQAKNSQKGIKNLY